MIFVFEKEYLNLKKHQYYYYLPRVFESKKLKKGKMYPNLVHGLWSIELVHKYRPYGDHSLNVLLKQ